MNWTVVKLSSVFSLIRNGVTVKQYENSGGIPITRIETISNGNINLNKLGYAGIKSDKFSDFYLKPGDVLMSHINSWKHLGKTALVGKQNKEIIHGMNLLLLRPQKDLLISKYAKLFFETDLFKNQLHKISNQSVNQSSFAISKLRDLKIPLPPLSIQKEIVEILDNADALRKKDLELLESYDALAQSLFIDMFGDPAQNKKAWELGTVRDIIIDAKYGTSKPAESEGEFPYLRMNNITYGGDWDFSSLKYINLNEKELDKYLLMKYDVVFNRTNSKELVGKTAVYCLDTKMVIAGYLIRVRTNFKGNPFYLSAYLNSKHGKAKLIGMCKSIVGMANINAQELQNIPLLIPPIDLQDHFAIRIQNIEKQKQKVKAQISASENLFQKILQDIFKE